MPSTTSTSTTRRASSFSATRWAVVAPTLPAPTTVILLTIVSELSEGDCCFRENYRGREPKLSPDLRQGAQSTIAAREQRVLLRLVGECLTHEWLERSPG